MKSLTLTTSSEVFEIIDTNPSLKALYDRRYRACDVFQRTLVRQYGSEAQAARWVEDRSEYDYLTFAAWSYYNDISIELTEEFELAKNEYLYNMADELPF